MRRSEASRRRESRFGALDLAGVLALLALGAGVVLPAVEHSRALRRDALRLNALSEVQDAIERHRLRTGAWPKPDGTMVADGWDASHDGSFLAGLLEDERFDEDTLELLGDESFHLRYRVFGQASCACAGPDGFYVLGLRAFETERYAARRPGGIACGHRDWSREFEHVRGGGIDGE